MLIYESFNTPIRLGEGVGGRGESQNMNKTDKLIYSYNTVIARKLRHEQTNAEKLLWERLRRKDLNGFKFKRQHGFGNYIVDFYCSKAKLIIELDGKIHDKKENKEKDKIREEDLIEHGFMVMRFKNEEVENEIDKVLDKIKETVLTRLKIK